MRVTPLAIPDVLLIAPPRFTDARGHFSEIYRADEYAAAGIGAPFVQDNLSFSQQGALRGLHFQNPNGQGKLVFVPLGEVLDVAVDVRAGSPTFGHAVSTTLSAENGLQIFVPPGFAHGFFVTSPVATVVYKCSDYYAPAAEFSVRWNDPALAIEWPSTKPTLSPRDAAAPLLREIPRNRLPRWHGQL